MFLKKFSISLVWLAFLLSFGFSGGGCFLLFAIVPFENWLVNRGNSQEEIDSILQYFVYGWVVFGFLVSLLFYVFLLRPKKRRKAAYGLTVAMMVIAALVFLQFMKTDSALIAISRGTIEEAGERFTFGPYPERENMVELKQDGYDGIITLLNPTIPFEKQLLDRELKNGAEIGLTIHSFPMLPWIADNAESIQAIKRLVTKGEGKYYIHCYLGKHRVDLAKRAIMDATGAKMGQRMTIFPSDFERGNVYTYDNGKVILGPYPTKEEWAILIRNQVKEIILFLNPDSSFYKEAKAITRDSGLRFTPILIEQGRELTQLQEVIDYVNELEHKVFIADFRSDGAILQLETMLRKQEMPIESSRLPRRAKEEGMIVGSWIQLGPHLDGEEWEALGKSGIKTVVSLGEVNEEAKQKIYSTHMHFEHRPIPENDRLQALYNLAKEMDVKSVPVYVSGDNEALISLHRILQGMYYGVDEQVKGKDGVRVVERDIVIGPVLSEADWSEWIVKNGMREVVFLYAASVHSEELLKQHENSARKHGVSFYVIDMFEDYREKLYKRLESVRGTKYVVVPSEAGEEVYTVLTDY